MQKILSTLAAIVFLVACTLPLHATKVNGKVIDEAGNPIPFATIQEKGTKTAVSCTADGHFAITVRSSKAILQVRALGYYSKELLLKDTSFLLVTLQPASQALNEVVVVRSGYMSKQRKMSAVDVMKVTSQQISGTTMHPLPGAVPAPTNGEGYAAITETEFVAPTANPLSTFSIDVDAASYSNVRRFLKEGSLPPMGAVRIEEMINYFSYQYPQPAKDRPFSITTEISQCPWNPRHQLALIALQGKKIAEEKLPASNLVFLIDVSGSMMDENKLPLLQKSLKLLTEKLREEDKVSIVVYAGNAGLVLPPTSGDNKTAIKDAIDALYAGGSTAGGAGIQLAYKTAEENFMEDGNNRVILCTDGDFNVGISSNDALERLIADKRATGVFLTVLGFGTGNYQDDKMQQLATKGNGNHAYIDQLSEAQKVLVNEFGGTLFTIAKDVKLQVEFNPAQVAGYRLIGYENRLLAKEDFNDDKKDAGELGSGHTVTALYEIIPAGVVSNFIKTVDALKYQAAPTVPAPSFTNEMMHIKLRYKQPDGDNSSLLQVPVMANNRSIEKASNNLRFAAAVAGFGMLLRQSKFMQQSTYPMVADLAKTALGPDKEGYRREFVKLVKKAHQLSNAGQQPLALAEAE
jgi:Ca-activated chloride channel homolog